MNEQRATSNNKLNKITRALYLSATTVAIKLEQGWNRIQNVKTVSACFEGVDLTSTTFWWFTRPVSRPSWTSIRSSPESQSSMLSQKLPQIFFWQIKASMAAQLSWYQWQNTCLAGQWSHSYQDNQCNHLPVTQGMFPTRVSKSSMQTANAD